MNENVNIDYLDYGKLRYKPKNKTRNALNIIKYMLNRTNMMFRTEGAPDTMPNRELELRRQMNGHLLGIKHEGKLYALPGNFAGVPDANGVPKQYLVVNKALNLSKLYNIGEDCVLLRNDSLCMGLLPLLEKYAYLMAENELTMANVITLCRAMLVFTGDKDNDIPEIKNYLQALDKGDIGVIGTEKFISKNGTVEVQPGAVQAGSIFTNLIEMEQYFKASMWNELGLNANWNAKRENLTQSENLMNTDILMPLIDDMRRCREDGWKEFNEMFGTDITVSLDSAWEDNDIEMELSLEAMEVGEETSQNEEVPDNEEKEKAD